MATEISETNLTTIQQIVGRDHVRPAVDADSVEGTAAKWVIEPGTITELSELLKFANVSGLHVIARGGGTKLDWGNPPRMLDLVVSTKRLNQVIEHADGDMTATVQAGCTIAELTRTLAQRGQRLALDPLWPERATVGGIIATNDSGPLRPAYGTLRDHLIGVTTVLADGVIARTGGKVVKNVAGYDLQKLITGSWGTLGIIAQATLRLYPLARDSRSLAFSGDASLDSVIAAMRQCSPVTSAVQFQIGRNMAMSIIVLVEALPEAMQGKVEQVERSAQSCSLSMMQICPDDWSAGEHLFDDPGNCVAKFSLLPTRLAGMVNRVGELAARYDADWKIVGQTIGVGLLGFRSTRMVELIQELQEITTAAGGSIAILRCATGLKKQIQVWPDVGNSLPLMRRIKDQFDPNGILSPGRFVGGI